MALRKATALALAVSGLAVAAPAADANFHLMKVREIRAATGGAIPFVELQMWSPGQTQLAGHHVTTYAATGTVIDDVPMTNVANGENQRTILVAPGTVDGQAPDVTHTLGFGGPGGAVCFDAIPVDCLAYGTFNAPGMLPGAVGTPFAAYPDANAALSLTRSIAPGCPTLLEEADDTDTSATDFAVTPATPRNNSTPPNETACGGGADGGGGGGGGTVNRPQTTITEGPKKKSTKRRVKIAFESDEPRSTFKCKLDKGAFEACESPFKARVKRGRHRFAVFAVDADGNEDQSPAEIRFKVKRAKRR
jgi:hypothetical protein